ncbi:MAG TPA: TetR/AcrR family transcriptional regulator [Candidatus Hydrogenedentes bacterium]|nr:TetR/AcrR family transcriptional regulator [Candidatus Hydrogenedentota bacterium]
MARKKLDTEVRQEQIAEAAMQVIQVHGLKGFSVERIAQHVGIVPSAIYRHFPNKGAVLDAALDLIHGHLLNMVAEARNSTSDPLDQLHGLLLRHIRLAQQFQAIPRLLFSDHVYFGNPARKAKMFGIFKDYLGQVAQLAKEAQREGKIRKDIPPDTFSAMFIGLFQPAAMLWYMSDGSFDATRHCDRAWRFLCEGIPPPALDNQSKHSK